MTSADAAGSTPSAPGEEVSATDASVSPAPRMMGDFRVVRKLGEGGMGTVYEAEQQHPHRPVALKVIRGEAYVDDTRVKLFRREAEILARLKHPSIAAIYEMGRTDDGQHFFAMELVRGETLGEYLRTRSGQGSLVPLDLRERLGLFREICEAVAYAHQRGIIHRDLKPSNILVLKESPGSSASFPGIPAIKILDFGLARITDADLAISTVVSDLGTVRGTLPYMSPEQVRGNPDEVDLRTDVYSLGVILYEMLTAELPYDLRQVAIPEVARVICEEPPRPLSRTWRGSKRLDPDVATIVMKALEKEPARRYQSVAALAEDLQRYLANQPILARPPSSFYQFRKLVARHKAPFAFIGALFLVLAVVAGAMTVQAGRIARERDRANKEAATAKEIAEFMTKLFEVSDPGEARGNTITVRQILDKGAERIDKELSEQPELQAGLMNTMGVVYRNLGLYSPAETLLEKALETRKRVLSKDHPDTLTAMNDLAVLYKRQGRYDEAERLYLEAIEGRGRVLGKDDRATLAAVNNLAVLYTDQGRHVEAEPLQLQVLEGFRRVLGQDHRNTLAAKNNLAYFYQNQGRYDEAEPLYLEAIEAQSRVLGPDHPNTLWSKNNLANIHKERGHYEEAERLHLETLEARRRVLGEDHPQTMLSKNNLATVYERQGRYGEAERLLLETLEGFERTAGESHPDTAWSLEALIRVYTAKKETGKARSNAVRLLSIRRKAAQRAGTGPEDKNRYARLLLTCGQADLRDPQAALTLAIEVNDLTGHEVPKYLDTLSLAYYLTGQVEKAIESERKAISLLPKGESAFRSEFEARLAQFKAARNGGFR